MEYAPTPDAHVRVFGQVVTGHGVASGRADDPRFPDGTLALQWPHFDEVPDLSLEGLHRATLNVSTSPWHVELVAPWWRLRNVRWHPDVPAETFSFVPCRVIVGQGRPVDGFVYEPDPDTKPEHHQPPDVLELLLPFLAHVHEGAIVRIDLPISQVDVAGPEVTDPAAVAVDRNEG